MKIFLIFALVLINFNSLVFAQNTCLDLFKKESPKNYSINPRNIDAAQTFDHLVDWIYNDLIITKKAPGFVIGISGTDSIIAFLAAAKAFERAGRPERVVGIHYGEQLPAAEVLAKLDRQQDFWFQADVVPWLKLKAPGAQVIVDSSINYFSDSQRWGALMDWSIVKDPKTGALRFPQDRYWLIGTQNATERALMNYSNISNVASIQVLTHIWKSEVLKISQYLDVPIKALQKSCEADCVCGRFEIAALNIPEVDALLMVRAGLLSKGYVENNIPETLRKTLDVFIESQITNSEFKKRIPYLPDESVVQVRDIISADQMAEVKKAISENGDSKPITKLLPTIISSKDSNTAADLVNVLSQNRTAWLPEALMLFNTPGLRISQLSQMLSNVFSHKSLSMIEEKILSKVAAKLGNYGFSFPQWRFISQKYGDQGSLAEQFGMTRLSRSTDVRDESLPFSNPQRDLYGAGYFKQIGNWYIEYRRAYIICSNTSESGSATVIIRNSSYFFGRDRLKNPVYVSWDKIDPKDLQALTPEMFEESGRFIPVQGIFQAQINISTTQKIKDLDRLLTKLDEFNMSMNDWFVSTQEGRNALLGFLEQKVNNGPSIYVTAVHDSSPSWLPAYSKKVDEELTKELKAGINLIELLGGDANSDRAVIMSGEHGDYP